MKAFYSLIVLLGIILVTSCKKDPCKNTSCLNGGACVDGTCNCPTGYSGTKCENYDPCANVNCKNGGTCANGICNCPIGYTGSDCGTEKTPVSMTITKIHLAQFPTDASGLYWDPSSGLPDIFLSINSGTTSNTNDFVSATANNVSDFLTVTYTTNFPVTIPTLSNNWTIGLWDYDDFDPNDFMGGIYFQPINYKSGFPSTIRLYNSSTRIDMTLYVTWNF